MSSALANPWTEAKALADLHACRTADELHRELSHCLHRILPGAELAFGLADGTGRYRVELVHGSQCPWQVGDRVLLDEWSNKDLRRVPIDYRSHRLGKLVLVPDALHEGAADAVEALLAHYAQAIASITLNDECRQATEQYCASLQALEEGIVLFQEEDREAVMARLLSLAMTLGQATAGVLYVLQKVGDPDSGLVLDQVMGIPDTLLASFRSTDERPWHDALLGGAAAAHVRGEDGSLASLSPEGLPSVLQNLVVVPLRYHGVEAGLVVLFNAALDVTDSADYLGRAQSLGQLGAALLHRLQLEAHAVRTRSIARELQIAETIQKRLLPTKAPDADEYDFAWCSIAAQDIGGDYLDLVSTDSGDVCAVIADASGHGINSALLMSSFRSTYRAAAGRRTPAELAQALNEEVVNEVGATGMFITAVVLHIDRLARRLTMTSAGHNPALLYRQKTKTIELVDSHGPPLGFVPGITYETFQIEFDPGDVLFLYTDGITEAADHELEMFGEERLKALMQKQVDSPSSELLAAAQKALREFTGRDRHEDDVSLLVIKSR